MHHILLAREHLPHVIWGGAVLLRLVDFIGFALEHRGPASKVEQGANNQYVWSYLLSKCR
jgi:hypothetical protein